jgi:predicted DNA-binding WGR domain protein
MSKREFAYKDDKSDKFWIIELDGASHVVQFGRTGTAGQSKRKDFGSAEEARVAYDKLVREKLREGYVEQGESAAAKPASATPIAAKPTAPHTITKSEPEKKEPEQNEPLEKIVVMGPATRSIDLDPVDWLWATWRPRPRIELPPPAPFDREACVARLGRVTTRSHGWVWNFARAELAPTMTREEAHFWLAAMEKIDKEKPKERAAELAKKTFDGKVSVEKVKQQIKEAARSIEPDFLLPLVNLLPTRAISELVLDDKLMAAEWSLATDFLAGFRAHVLPRMPEDEIEELKATLRPRIDPKRWPSADHYQRPPNDFMLASFLGLHAELARVVESWPDKLYAGEDWRDYYHQPQIVVLGLGSAQEVEQQMRRLRLLLKRPAFVRAWLAHTEYAALDYVRDTILAIKNKDEAGALLEVLALVHAPEVAGPMLELKRSSKVPKGAVEWLEGNVAHAIAGLVVVAAGRGALAEAAIAQLLDFKRAGHEAAIRACLDAAPADLAKVRAAVLEQVERSWPALETAPPWLATALSSLAHEKAKPPSWVTPLDLPPVVLGDRRLQDEQVSALLAALSKSTLEERHPLVEGVRTHGDRDAIARFAFRLFERWVEAGAPPKEKWALAAVGQFGNDASALELAKLVRLWPGEGQHQRAILGLECLRTIGTDGALMQLNGIAQKVKFKALQSAATGFMEEIATARKMSRAELEDRIVPDCDLDEKGSRLFDFGARKFWFVLGPEMKPIVRDEAGKKLPDLPKPGGKDDATLAEAAVAEWKLMKKQIREVAKIQADRLEQAMVSGRRWKSSEFEQLLVRHPLMTHLVRLLVWAAYDAKGTLAGTFRVAEDGTYADARDEKFSLGAAAQVGVVHPLHLSPEVRAAWGTVFGDYQIIPPFPQLGRPLFALEKGEEKASEIVRFAKKKIASPTLVSTLEKLGWSRGTPEDAGIFSEHSKRFYAADVTAFVEYPGVPVGSIVDWEDQQIERCYFLSGLHAPGSYRERKGAMKLGQVDAVVLSEVLHDLTLLADKARA